PSASTSPMRRNLRMSVVLPRERGRAHAGADLDVLAAAGPHELARLVRLDGRVLRLPLRDAFGDTLVAVGLQPVDRLARILGVDVAGARRTGGERIAHDREAFDRPHLLVEDLADLILELYLHFVPHVGGSTADLPLQVARHRDRRVQHGARVDLVCAPLSREGRDGPGRTAIRHDGLVPRRHGAGPGRTALDLPHELVDELLNVGAAARIDLVALEALEGRVDQEEARLGGVLGRHASGLPAEAIVDVDGVLERRTVPARVALRLARLGDAPV